MLITLEKNISPIVSGVDVAAYNLPRWFDIKAIADPIVWMDENVVSIASLVQHFWQIFLRTDQNFLSKVKMKHQWIILNKFILQIKFNVSRTLLDSDVFIWKQNIQLNSSILPYSPAAAAAATAAA